MSSGIFDSPTRVRCPPHNVSILTVCRDHVRNCYIGAYLNASLLRLLSVTAPPRCIRPAATYWRRQATPDAHDLNHRLSGCCLAGNGWPLPTSWKVPVFRSIRKGGKVTTRQLSAKSVCDLVKKHAGKLGLNAAFRQER